MQEYEHNNRTCQEPSVQFTLSGPLDASQVQRGTKNSYQAYERAHVPCTCQDRQLLFGDFLYCD